jgi:NAD(P)-dependent dehydrogenase (short-subunit alcohol dehydrogenase family)
VLVNNAGYSHFNKLMWKITVEEFDGGFAVNLVAAVTFLASDDADFVTGTSLNVDGGRSV